MTEERTPDQTDLPEGTAEENPDRERTSMDTDLGTAEDPLLRSEESAAAAEAGRVGGPAPDYAGDEAARPVEEGGGGVAEGFEEAERELIDAASHGDGGGSPEIDAFTPEAESDEATAEYGEADEEQPPDR